MAYIYKKQRVDDLDGESEADSEVKFTVDGNKRVIHLSKAHADEFRAILAPYVKASRPDRVSQEGKYRSRQRVKLLREWAMREGHDMPDTGRPPKWLVDEYVRATGNTY